MADNYAFGKPKLGKKSFIEVASPGPRNPRSAVSKDADGSCAKPGGATKIPSSARGGQPQTARPGGAQKIKG